MHNNIVAYEKRWIRDYNRVTFVCITLLLNESVPYDSEWNLKNANQLLLRFLQNPKHLNSFNAGKVSEESRRRSWIVICSTTEKACGNKHVISAL